ncbi:GTP cyclohydrolase II-domain-containing protein, partial [Piptocephalis cylindrospora]
VTCQVSARIPSAHGTFRLLLYRSATAIPGTADHLAIVYGDDIQSVSLSQARPDDTDFTRRARGALPSPPSLTPDMADTTTDSSPPLVRIHSECLTGEVLGSQRCDCGEQLETAMEALRSAGRGVIVYLRQEGRGIGLLDKLRAYNLQDEGLDTVNANLALGHPADARSYTVATTILRDLSLNSGVSLLTNNPDKMEQLEADGIRVVSRVAMVPRTWSLPSTPQNGKHPQPPQLKEMDAYLRTKIERMRHLLDLPVSL